MDYNPELQFGRQPEAALRQYCDLGFHIERELVDAADCEAIKQAARSFPSHENGSLKPVMMPHRLRAEFADVMKTPGIVSIMERLVGGRVSGLQTQFFFCRPGAVGFTAHQDNTYVQSGPGAFASAWLALDRVDRENGCLVVYPGSHAGPLLDVVTVTPESSFGQDPNANVQETALPDGYESCDVLAGRGDVVFLHGHLVHKSRNNVSDSRFRHVLLMTYLRQGAPFRPGFAARRAEFDVY